MLRAWWGGGTRWERMPLWTWVLVAVLLGSSRQSSWRDILLQWKFVLLMKDFSRFLAVSPWQCELLTSKFILCLAVCLNWVEVEWSRGALNERRVGEVPQCLEIGSVLELVEVEEPRRSTDFYKHEGTVFEHNSFPILLNDSQFVSLVLAWWSLPEAFTMMVFPIEQTKCWDEALEIMVETKRPWMKEVLLIQCPSQAPSQRGV